MARQGTVGANGSADWFAEQVMDALAHLWDPIHLEGHPLAPEAPGGGGGSGAGAGAGAGGVRAGSAGAGGEQNGAHERQRGGRSGARLRQWLLDAITALEPERGTSPAAAAWRGYQLLNLRYVEGLTVEAVQAELGVSRAQFYREHRRAVDAVVSILSRQRARGEDALTEERGPALSALGDRTGRPLQGSGGALPTGTVAFLFTDLEGSTRLLEAHPDAYREAVRRHHDLLGQAVARHGGRVFETVGDAVYAAFPQATDGVAAAVDGQLALQQEAWGELGELRARMGIHTGEVELQARHYFGVPLYRGGRLMAAAHGGQTVVSEATATLVKDALPEGVALRDLGLHRLRDMHASERVYQVVHPALPAEFPPLRTLDALPHNLPAQSTPFLGREREVAAVRARLRRPEVRLLTLLGPGGTGKTRLALQVAAESVVDFPQGVFFVSLAGISDPSLVASTVASALGVQEAGGRSPAEALRHHLRHRMTLLVLDNCEHVVEGCVVVAELLASCPHVKILATSRVALRLAGEHEVQVPPLAVPLPTEWGGGAEASGAAPTGHAGQAGRAGRAERLSQYEAVRLFLDRAQAAQPAFQITEENAPAVAEICYRLDGLPLAIELAAARVKLLPPHALLARLGHRLALLTSGPRDLPARHQTLRAAVGWSYDLLTEQERVLFRRLGVFVGGWDLEAVEAICGTPEAEMDALEGVSSLMDKNLVRRADGIDGAGRPPGDEPRFAMLETIREFAREALALSGEEAALRRRHAAHYEALLDRAKAPLRHWTAQSFTWLDRLAREHDNLRAALRWLVDQGEAGRALATSEVLFHLWRQRGHFTEGRRWLEEILALPGAAARTERRAQALNHVGILLAVQGRVRDSFGPRGESVAISKEVGDLRSAARKLQYMGYAHMELGEMAAARSCSQESAEISRGLGQTHELAWRLQDLVLFALAEGDVAAAQRYGEESRDAFAAMGEQSQSGCFGWAMAQVKLGMVARKQGEHERARALIQDALAVFQQMEKPHSIGHALAQLGRVELDAGDLAQARAAWSAQLGLCQSTGEPLEIAFALERFSLLAAAEGDDERALRLLGAAEATRETLGSPADPAWSAELAERLAGALARPEASAVREAGRATSVEDAIACALSPRSG